MVHKNEHESRKGTIWEEEANQLEVGEKETE